MRCELALGVELPEDDRVEGGAVGQGEENLGLARGGAGVGLHVDLHLAIVMGGVFALVGDAEPRKCGVFLDHFGAELLAGFGGGDFDDAGLPGLFALDDDGEALGALLRDFLELALVVDHGEGAILREGDGRLSLAAFGLEGDGGGAGGEAGVLVLGAEGDQGVVDGRLDLLLLIHHEPVAGDEDLPAGGGGYLDVFRAAAYGDVARADDLGGDVVAGLGDLTCLDEYAVAVDAEVAGADAAVVAFDEEVEAVLAAAEADGVFLRLGTVLDLQPVGAAGGDGVAGGAIEGDGGLCTGCVYGVGQAGDGVAEAAGGLGHGDGLGDVGDALAVSLKGDCGRAGGVGCVGLDADGDVLVVAARAGGLFTALPIEDADPLGAGGGYPEAVALDLDYAVGAGEGLGAHQCGGV